MEKKLSVIQRYVLFALAKKPGVYVFHKDEMGVGLYVAGVMELLGADVAALDEKGRLRLEKPLPADLAYLTPLYETLEELRPQKPAAAAKKYVATFLNRRMNELALSVAESLERTGSLVREERSGLFGETVRYPVPAEVLNDQVEALRKTILSSGPLEDGDVVLAVLLLVNWNDARKERLLRRRRTERRRELA